ncbi:MAG: hypothetical protein M1823_003750 [Watsoniomyces obsoletus]|nr:MAG: hypothetical protein M1823_003750 [Watsoniomyces obsoletus]
MDYPSKRPRLARRSIRPSWSRCDTLGGGKTVKERSNGEADEDALVPRRSPPEAGMGEEDTDWMDLRRPLQHRGQRKSQKNVRLDPPHRRLHRRRPVPTTTDQPHVPAVDVKPILDAVSQVVNSVTQAALPSGLGSSQSPPRDPPTPSPPAGNSPSPAPSPSPASPPQPPSPPPPPSPPQNPAPPNPPVQASSPPLPSPPSPPPPSNPTPVVPTIPANSPPSPPPASSAQSSTPTTGPPPPASSVNIPGVSNVPLPPPSNVSSSPASTSASESGTTTSAGSGSATTASSATPPLTTTASASPSRTDTTSPSRPDATSTSEGRNTSGAGTRPTLVVPAGSSLTANTTLVTSTMSSTTSSGTTSSSIVLSTTATLSSNQPTFSPTGSMMGVDGVGAGGGSPTGAPRQPANGAGNNNNGGSSNTGSGLSPPTQALIGGIVGGLAGLALLLLLILFLLRWRKRKQQQNQQQTLQKPPQTRQLAAAEPASSGGLPPPPSSSATGSPTAGPSERGFYRVSGRKIAPVFGSGGDGYQGTTISEASFYRDDDRTMVTGAGPSSSGTGTVRPMSPGSPMMDRASGGVASSSGDDEYAVMRPSPARTPVTSHGPSSPPPPGRFPSPTIGSPPRRPHLGVGVDGLGRSHPSQDGSRGSRFTEDVG